MSLSSPWEELQTLLLTVHTLTQRHQKKTGSGRESALLIVCTLSSEIPARAHPHGPIQTHHEVKIAAATVIEHSQLAGVSSRPPAASQPTGENTELLAKAHISFCFSCGSRETRSSYVERNQQPSGGLYCCGTLSRHAVHTQPPGEDSGPPAVEHR